MEINIPPKETKRWTGSYLGKYYGSIWNTFNVDLENTEGSVSLGRSMLKLADSSDTNLLNIGTIDNFLRTNADGLDRYWALTRKGRLCKTDSSNPTALTDATWDEDTLTGSPTDGRDMTIHENDSDSVSGENQLFVTRDTDIAVLNDTGANTWNANWWVTTKSQTALKTGQPHPIEYFPFQRISLVGDGNLIHTIDKNENISYARLTIPVWLRIWGIFTTSNRAWILCSGLQGHNGAVVEWDGYSGTYNAIHDVQSVSALSGTDFNGIPVVVNNKGSILEYNGNTFVPMIRNGQIIAFPLQGELGNSFAIPSMTAGAQMGIAPRGMAATDDGLIHINAEHPNIASLRQHGGIWCLNPMTGRLYSKHSLQLGGDTDYGHQILTSGGAIRALNVSSNLSNIEYFLAGGTISGYSGIWAVAIPNKVRRGYFTTQFIQADNVEEMWENIWLDLSKFKSTNDKIIVKAKGVNSLSSDVRNSPLNGTVTWTSTTTFTIQLSASADALAIGDEVEVLSGKNAGVLAHITDIAGNHAAVQTITIDETVAVGSGTSICYFDRWKKLGIIDDTSKYTVPLNIKGITSSFIQFKIELRGIGLDFEIKRLIANSTAQIKSKK